MYQFKIRMKHKGRIFSPGDEAVLDPKTTRIFLATGFIVKVPGPEPEPEPEPETVLTLGRREKRRPASPDWEIARNRTISLREAAESVADIEAARFAAREALKNGLSDAEIIRAMRNDDDPGPLIDSS